MKKEQKRQKCTNVKREKGITLIALVITIIVILILAGISLSSLRGRKGIINQVNEAKLKSVHANIFEAMQIEEHSYIATKGAINGTQSFAQYLQSKQIIGSEIEEGKYQINVEKLMGEKQEYGNGTASNSSLKDVYMLEEQIESGKILNVTELASTMPIKIATSSGGNIEIYAIKYYGKKANENATLGTIEGSYKIPKSLYGYNEQEDCFIGQKCVDETYGELNSQRANWDESKNGYKFTSGHFLNVPNYSGDVWTGDSIEHIENIDVYFCWDGDYGEISSEGDLVHYHTSNNGATVRCDVFDASSGAFLSVYFIEK